MIKTHHLLTLNAGSSSLKFALFALAGDTPRLVAGGQADGLGARAHFKVKTAEGQTVVDRSWQKANEGPANARDAMALVLEWLRGSHGDASLDAVGHRIVHGGPIYGAPVVLDDGTLKTLEGFNPLAPLHQPHNLAGVEAAREAFPEALQVGCFDTAFHRAHSWVNDTFALPRRFYDEGVRRYGFHGLSYEYVSQALRDVAPHHAKGRVVIAHLGNGASMCALMDGQSVGSTMGFSALDGLPMGTRCGQIDPGVLLYLMDHHGMDAKALTALLYKESGLKGLSGLSQDMRELEASHTPEAAEAVDYFVQRIRREIGGMAALLGGLDALVFCGGIGENADRVRERVCAGFDWMGIELDDHRNRTGQTVISSERSRCRVLVIRTNEEAVIARHTLALLQDTSGKKRAAAE